MDKIRSIPGLRKAYGSSPENVQDYFSELPRILEAGLSLDVALAYVFARVELAHGNCLYCGIVKLHKVDSGLAGRAVQKFHMTREVFRNKYLVIYGRPIPEALTRLMTFAESVRDRVLHGKDATDDQKRNAIAHVLEYSKELNDYTFSLAGLRPFADLRGFKGAATALGSETSRWVLQGMGFLGKPTDQL
jgi:hypothetical protein